MVRLPMERPLVCQRRPAGAAVVYIFDEGRRVEELVSVKVVR
jgi:hypothetical protein